MKNPHDVIVRALVTEKGTRQREAGNRFFFQVHRGANKLEIKQAIEQVFGVHVESVRTQHVPGKTKKLGRFVGSRSSWKKAIVTLRTGENIDLFEEV